MTNHSTVLLSNIRVGGCNQRQGIYTYLILLERTRGMRKRLGYKSFQSYGIKEFCVAKGFTSSLVALKGPVYIYLAFRLHIII